MLLLIVVDCAWDDDAPEYAKERLAKADDVPADPQTDSTLKPTVYADILVYDAKQANCVGAKTALDRPTALFTAPPPC